MSHLVSDRGHFLLLNNLPTHRPIVTVEAHTKWYGLYLVRPGPEVEEIAFPDHESLTAYVDHVPNPVVVKEWADAQGYDIDELSLEMMTGRWQLEVGKSEKRGPSAPISADQVAASLEQVTSKVNSAIGEVLRSGGWEARYSVVCLVLDQFTQRMPNNYPVPMVTSFTTMAVPALDNPDMVADILRIALARIDYVACPRASVGVTPGYLDTHRTCWFTYRYVLLQGRG